MNIDLNADKTACAAWVARAKGPTPVTSKAANWLVARGAFALVGHDEGLQAQELALAGVELAVYILA
jgi:hypothetical protein